MPAPKVVLIGNSGAGKSYVWDTLRGYESDSEPTLGVRSGSYRGYSVWDCAGHEEYMGLGSGYYHRAQIAIVFHGGEDFRTPEEWIAELPDDCKVYHAQGSLQKKLDQVRTILE